MEEYVKTRLELQLICEDISNLIYHYHIGLENPECQAVDYPVEIMQVFEQALQSMSISNVYLQRITALISGEDSDETFLTRLKDDLESTQSAQNIIKPVETLNERVVREVLEAEITALKKENEGLKALTALLEEVPMAHPKIA